MFDVNKCLLAAKSKIGAPYLLGGEWNLKDPNPKGPVDCSEFIEWAYAQGGARIPDGAHNQYLASEPDLEQRPGAVGFFKTGEANCHHVGMLFDAENVIEARGKPYNEVILRPRQRWELWRDFTGWRRFKKLENI